MAVLRVCRGSAACETAIIPRKYPEGADALALVDSGSVSASGAGTYPNEPVGAIQVVKLPMKLGNFVGTLDPDTESASQPFSYILYSDPLYSESGTTVTDPTAPVHPETNGIGRLVMNAGNTGYGPNYDNGSCYHYGNSIEKWDSQKFFKTAMAGWTEFYTSFYFKLSSNYRIIPGHQKIWSIRQDTGVYDYGWNIAIAKGDYDDPDTYGTATYPPFRINIYYTNTTPSTNFYSAPDGGEAESWRYVDADTWTRVEMLVNRSTLNHKLWLNGVKVIDGDVTLPLDTNDAIGSVWWVWTYGGAIGCEYEPPVFDWTQYIYHDEWYISVVS